MRVAYADPPYINQAKRHYSKEPDYAGEVDHEALVLRLITEFPDGWALSCSSPSLGQILGYLEMSSLKGRYRIAAWVKPFHVYKRGVRPAYAWEPVIFTGGRNPPRYPHPPPTKGGTATTPKDFLACNITLKKGLVGAKPEAFSCWVFSLLNLQPGDELVDLFPGTGAVTEAWQKYVES